MFHLRSTGAVSQALKRPHSPTWNLYPNVILEKNSSFGTLNPYIDANNSQLRGWLYMYDFNAQTLKSRTMDSFSSEFTMKLFSARHKQCLFRHLAFHNTALTQLACATHLPQLLPIQNDGEQESSPIYFSKPWQELVQPTQPISRSANLQNKWRTPSPEVQPTTAQKCKLKQNPLRWPFKGSSLTTSCWFARPLRVDEFPANSCKWAFISTSNLNSSTKMWVHP